MKQSPSCSKCATPLPVEYLNVPQLSPCLGCAAEVRGEIFPAYFREEVKGSSGEAVVIDSEASCFHHPQKRAVVVCVACGRFLCGLCDVELESSHYCPECLHTAQKKGDLKSIDNSRRLTDELAFHLSLLGLFIFYFSIITAPLAIYFAVKHWKSPLSLVRSSRWRYVVAIMVASLQILGGLALIIFGITRIL
jgi:hypothetical protein